MELMNAHGIRHLPVVEAEKKVGVISIVGSLLLLATEVRQSNRIATAEMEFSLSEGFMNMHVHPFNMPSMIVGIPIM